MLVWLVSYAIDVTPLIKEHTSTTGHVSIGAGIGVTIAVGMILFSWVAGSIILGLFVLFTRGSKILLPVENNADLS